MAKNIQFAMFLLMAANLAIVAVVFLGGGGEPPFVPMPNPNGYDTFRKAAQLLPSRSMPLVTCTRGVQFSSPPLIPPPSIGLSEDSEVVRLVRAGLLQECRVPIGFSRSYGSNAWNEASKCMELSPELQVSGMAAELDHRTNSALHFYLYAVGVARQCRHGGLMEHQLTGLANESFGLGDLKQIVSGLDREQCRNAAKELSELGGEPESVAVILARESNWKDRVYGHGFKRRLAAMVANRSLDPVKNDREQLEAETKRVARDAALILLDLAAREYHLEKGVPPGSAADLVPGYLKAVPRDLFTGTNLVWKP